MLIRSNNGIKAVKVIKGNTESKKRWGKEVGRICKRVGNERNAFEKTIPRKTQGAHRYFFVSFSLSFFSSKAHSFFFSVLIHKLRWFLYD